MRPKAAIFTCLRKSFVFSGRASRSEFWWFAPLGLLPPLLMAWYLDWNKIEIWGVWRILAVMVVAIPLLSAISRRLQDAGEDGNEAIYPFAPLIILWVGYQIILWSGFVILAVSPIISIIMWIIAFLILIPLHIIAFFASAMAAANVIGNLLVPSERASNKYGPNPHEVIP